MMTQNDKERLVEILKQIPLTHCRDCHVRCPHDEHPDDPYSTDCVYDRIATLLVENDVTFKLVIPRKE